MEHRPVHSLPSLDFNLIVSLDLYIIKSTVHMRHELAKPLLLSSVCSLCHLPHPLALCLPSPVCGLAVPSLSPGLWNGEWLWIDQVSPCLPATAARLPAVLRSQ